MSSEAEEMMISGSSRPSEVREPHAAACTALKFLRLTCACPTGMPVSASPYRITIPAS